MAYAEPLITGTTNQIDMSNLSMGQQMALASTLIRSSQPCFFATLSGNVTNATGDGTVVNLICDNQVFDAGANNYDPSTGNFTAPVTGNYLLCCSITLSNLLIGHSAMQYRMTLGPYRGAAYNPFTCMSAATSQFCMNFCDIKPLSASAAARPSLLVTTSTKTVTIVGGGTATWFAGYLIC